MCVCVCVCACARACVRVSVCVCVFISPVLQVENVIREASKRTLKESYKGPGANDAISAGWNAIMMKVRTNQPTNHHLNATPVCAWPLLGQSCSRVVMKRILYGLFAPETVATWCKTLAKKIHHCHPPVKDNYTSLLRCERHGGGRSRG